MDTIRQLVEELNIELTVTLVRSAENRADCISRVPAEWLRSPDGDSSSSASEVVCAAAGIDDPATRDAVTESDVNRSDSAARQRSIRDVHARAGHPESDVRSTSHAEKSPQR